MIHLISWLIQIDPNWCQLIQIDAIYSFWNPICQKGYVDKCTKDSSLDSTFQTLHLNWNKNLFPNESQSNRILHPDLAQSQEKLGTKCFKNGFIQKHCNNHTLTEIRFFFKKIWLIFDMTLNLKIFFFLSITTTAKFKWDKKQC